MKEKKMQILCCVIVKRAKKRAACACERFFIKCLKWPKTYAKWFWDDFEHFQILRAHRRADVRVRARFFHEIDRTDIDLNHDKYEWEMPFRYEDMIMNWFPENFTKWRLDDVISEGQCWKHYCALYICLYICVPNLKVFDWAIFK